MSKPVQVKLVQGPMFTITLEPANGHQIESIDRLPHRIIATSGQQAGDSWVVLCIENVVTNERQMVAARSEPNGTVYGEMFSTVTTPSPGVKEHLKQLVPWVQ